MRKHTASTDIKRALVGRGFLIGAGGVVLTITLASLQRIIVLTRNTDPLPNGYHAQLVMAALSSDWVALALPIICTLPYTSSFVDDIKSGFIKQYLHRTDTASYIQGKLLACGLSGGLVLFLGILLAYGLSALVFMPMELALGQGEATQPYFAQILMQAALFFFSGAVWSLVGFTLSALTMNRYIAYASPFVLYYVLIILHERYFEALYVLYPREWLFPSKSWAWGSWGVVLLLLELIAIVSLAFAITAKRRLSVV